MAAKKVLVAIDGSRHSLEAFEWLLQNLPTSLESLIFVLVAEPPPLPHAIGLAGRDDAYAKCVAVELEAAARLAERVKLRVAEEPGLSACGVRFVQRLARSAGAAVVSVAEDEAVDLVVLGNRGRGLVRRTFLGSVSEYVLHHANRPVAIVPLTKTHPQDLEVTW